MGAVAAEALVLTALSLPKLRPHLHTRTRDTDALALCCQISECSSIAKAKTPLIEHKQALYVCMDVRVDPDAENCTCISNCAERQVEALQRRGNLFYIQQHTLTLAVFVLECQVYMASRRETHQLLVDVRERNKVHAKTDRRTRGTAKQSRLKSAGI